MDRQIRKQRGLMAVMLGALVWAGGLVACGGKAGGGEDAAWKVRAPQVGDTVVAYEPIGSDVRLLKVGTVRALAGDKTKVHFSGSGNEIEVPAADVFFVPEGRKTLRVAKGDGILFRDDQTEWHEGVVLEVSGDAGKALTFGAAEHLIVPNFTVVPDAERARDIAARIAGNQIYLATEKMKMEGHMTYKPKTGDRVLGYPASYVDPEAGSVLVDGGARVKWDNPKVGEAANERFLYPIPAAGQAPALKVGDYLVVRSPEPGSFSWTRAQVIAMEGARARVRTTRGAETVAGPGEFVLLRSDL